MSNYDDVFAERVRAVREGDGKSPEELPWCSPQRFVDIATEALAISVWLKGLDGPEADRGADVGQLRGPLVRLAAQAMAWLDNLDTLQGKV